MADALAGGRFVSGVGIEVSERLPRACVDVRGQGNDPRFVRAVTSVTHVGVPVQPCTSVAALFGSILWLGPDEWLVVSDSQHGEEVAARLREALQAMHAAVTDVSDARVVFALSGANAHRVLAKGCSIDFHPRVFLPGQCVQTRLAKASVMIHARTAQCVDVYAARSFSDYVWMWLSNAAGEYV